MSLRLKRACPKCHKSTVDIVEYRLKCQSCDFEIEYTCPLCDAEMHHVHLQEDDVGQYFNCGSCQAQIHLRRIQHLVDNGLHVDMQTRCKVCHGPTVHRQESNIGHRCFYFPKCAGQANLFGENRESLVFLDFETTGLEAGKDHIIEIGAYKIDKDGFEHAYQRFIKPPVDLPPKIIQITGITPEMLVNAPPMEAVMQEFADFLGDAKLVAHNAEFDVPWLLIASHNHNVPLHIQDKVMCTLKWAKAAGEGRASLGALTKKYHIGHANAHRALADAAATKELYFVFDSQYSDTKLDQPLGQYQLVAEKLIERYGLIKA